MSEETFLTSTSRFDIQAYKLINNEWVVNLTRNQFGQSGLVAIDKTLPKALIGLALKIGRELGED